MAKSYANIGYGSQGDDVKELQTMLNNNGYALDIDGVFGNKTDEAVKDYQQKNNITEDGVGSATWGALTTPKTETSAPSTEPAVQAPTKFEYTPYEKSDVVKQAEALLQQQLNNKPGAYQSPWQDQLNDILDKILNREEFSYDINGDAFAKMYQDKYTTMGKMAMMDTMGQAQAMTGGYGNSYAQQVGQQAYQGYVQEYNDRIPELYQLALDQYNREGDAMRDQASILASMEEQDYGRYRDQVGDYNAELDRLTEDARYQGELDYGKWQDAHDRAYNMFLQDQQTAEGKYNQLVSMITTLGYVPTDEELAAAGMSKEHYLAYKEYYDQQNPTTASSGGGGGGYDNGGLATEAIENMQALLGLDPDGKWGPNSRAAAQAKYGISDPVQLYKSLWGQGTPATPDYSDWDQGNWEHYFSAIRQSEGKAAAEEELNEFISKGYIPKNMVSYAAIGARGGSMGH